MSQSSWGAGVLAMMGVAVLGGCATQMTVADYLDQKLYRDRPGLQELVASADAAQAAFNLMQGANIEDAREITPDAQRETNAARNAARRIERYQRTDARSFPQQWVLFPQVESTPVELTDLDAANRDGVPIRDKRVRWKVYAKPDRVEVRALLSEYGKVIVTFDGRLPWRIDSAFAGLMRKDDIAMAGPVKVVIPREGDEVQTIDPAIHEPRCVPMAEEFERLARRWNEVSGLIDEAKREGAIRSAMGVRIRMKQHELHQRTRGLAGWAIGAGLSEWGRDVQRAVVELDSVDDDDSWDDDVDAIRGLTRKLRSFAAACRDAR